MTAEAETTGRRIESRSSIVADEFATIGFRCLGYEQHLFMLAMVPGDGLCAAGNVDW